MIRIGLYFGSFNPIHNGHIEIAKYCLKHCNLDDLYFMISPQNPFKQSTELIDFRHRYNMVEMFCQKKQDFFACDFENSLEKPSYTAHTVKRMKILGREDDEFVLIMGADNFLSLDKWKDSEYIKTLPMIVIPRLSSENENFEEHIKLLENMKNDIVKQYYNDNIIIAKGIRINPISSTFIRNEIKNGNDIGNYVPKVVEEYIKNNKLYGYENKY